MTGEHDEDSEGGIKIGYRALGSPRIMPYMEEVAFIDEGYLLEANRRFFRPLGLILLAQVLDYGLRLRCVDRRELQAGVVYEPNTDGRGRLRHAKIARVACLWETRAQARARRSASSALTGVLRLPKSPNSAARSLIVCRSWIRAVLRSFLAVH